MVSTTKENTFVGTTKGNTKDKKAKIIGDSRDKFQPISKSPTMT